MSSKALPFAPIAADADFEHSALVHAHHAGVNAVELDLLAQAISRLARDHSTVVPASLEPDLVEFVEMGYLEISPTACGTLSVALLCPGPLLTNYFWSVWVPRYLFRCSLKVGVLPQLGVGVETAEVQHFTAVFRIPGSKEAARQFLNELAGHYPGHEPELVAIQAGDRLSQANAPHPPREADDA